MGSTAVIEVAGAAVMLVVLAWVVTPHMSIGRRTRARARMRAADPLGGTRLRRAPAPAAPEELEAVENMACSGVIGPAEADEIRRDLGEQEAGGSDGSSPRSRM